VDLTRKPANHIIHYIILIPNTRRFYGITIIITIIKVILWGYGTFYVLYTVYSGVNFPYTLFIRYDSEILRHPITSFSAAENYPIPPRHTISNDNNQKLFRNNIFRARILNTLETE